MLSEGVQLYGADPRGAVSWFAHGLHYPYEPAADGAPSDWLMDLVSVGFAKPNGFAPRRACDRVCMKTPCICLPFQLFVSYSGSIAYIKDKYLQLTAPLIIPLQNTMAARFYRPTCC